MLSEFLSIRGILLLILIVLGVVSTLRSPKWGVIAYIVLFYIRDAFLMEWFPISFSILHLPQLFIILTLISWILHKSDLPTSFPLQMWFMLAFLVVIILSRYLNNTGVFDDKVTEEFIKMCVLCFLIINSVKDFKDIEQIIWALVLTNLFSTLYHYYQYKVGWKSIFVLTAYGGLNRNEFGSILASVCAVNFYLLKNNKKRIIKLFLFTSLLCLVGGVILTYSRSAALALVVVLLVTILVNKHKARNIIIVVILATLMYPHISQKYYNRMGTVENYEEDASAMGRVATNKAALNILHAHPALGIGAGNFNDQFIEYTPAELQKWVEPGKSIHNVFLQVASETGYSGLFIFILLLASSFIAAIKTRICSDRCKLPYPVKDMATCLGIALFGYLVALQFHPGAYYKSIYIYMPIIVALKVFAVRAEGAQKT